MKPRALSLFAVAALALFLLKPTVLAHEVEVGGASQEAVQETFADSPSVLHQLSLDSARPADDPELAPPSNFALYLPVVNKNPGGCSGIVTLIGPPNGASLDNIVPMFSWDAGAHPNSTALRLHIATDPDFSVISKSYLLRGYIGGPREHRFSTNFSPATTYYWRAWLECNDAQGPYSAVWLFTTGSGGMIPPTPTLIAPANGSTLSSLPVTLQWSSVAGAQNYVASWRTLDQSGRYFRLTEDIQTELTGLEPNTTYEWWVYTRSDYAYSDDSEIWQFTTPAGSSSSLGNNPDCTVLIEQKDGTYELSEVRNSRY